mmetsp:Transcript_3077/g.8141  ORF Transcript_3077/g.8141 Transcript_3077/m.8141 type:complete len:153 (-) Transcript_3077:6-464(-)
MAATAGLAPKAARGRASAGGAFRGGSQRLTPAHAISPARQAARTSSRAPLRVSVALVEIPSLSSDVGYSLAYSTIGASAVGFIGTFLIAPRFRSSFKEEESWLTMYDDLVDAKTRTISPEEAARKRGAVLLDVRLANKAAAAMADGSLNIPL